MDKQNIEIVESYYQAMNIKNIEVMESYLHPKISFQCPFTKISNKESFIEAVKSVLLLFENLEIKSICVNKNNEVILIYDLNCLKPLGAIRIAAYLKLEDALITNMELFYDPRPMMLNVN